MLIIIILITIIMLILIILNFLSSRTQAVTINGVLSDFLPVTI